jgi:4-amino-4-deoxy-L-arabinose transferase-like glycosyltransferase
MELFKQITRVTWLWIYSNIVGFYLISHLLLLTALPVFADEAIYIRWSQLMIDDWQRYAFFPLNDGKTPLQMWLMIPFLNFFSDQLFAGRFLSVLVGVGQIIIVQKLIKKLGGGFLSQVLGMVWVSVLPFWFFHHRMALIDALITFFLTLVLYGLFQLTSKLKPKQKMLWTLITGLSFAAALYTKVPAIFFSMVFVFFSLRNVRWPFTQEQLKHFVIQCVWLGIAGAIGIAGFLTLKLNPAFGQLFSRGNDFTFTIQEVLTKELHTPFFNLYKVSGWILAYLSPVLVLLPLIWFRWSKKKRIILLLYVSSLLFALPFIGLGKVLAPRYFLPSAIGITVSAALCVDEMKKRKFPHKKSILVAVSLFPIVWSLPFLVTSWFNVNQIPFVSVDRVQYQTEWSAGFGHREVTHLIEEKAKEGRIVVATEGSFGTLPDGILMDLHNKPVNNIEVYGIGAPIVNVPDTFIQKARQSESAWIVVNSHRMKTNDPRLKRIHSFPRPFNAPSLDVYEFSE